MPDQRPFTAARCLLRRVAAAACGMALAASAWAAPGDNPPAEPTALPAAALAASGAELTAPATPRFVDRMRDTASDMVLTAMNFLGVPYRRGGNSEYTGFDCSGFTRHVFEMSLGLVLPRRADEQAKAPGFVPVRKTELKPGDLVFFNTLRRTFSHVGIYIGEGKFIHSPKPGGEVRVDDIGMAYWARRFTGARRADSDASALGAQLGSAAAFVPHASVLAPPAAR